MFRSSFWTWLCLVSMVTSVSGKRPRRQIRRQAVQHKPSQTISPWLRFRTIKPDPDLTDAVEALLSQQPHLVVLERRQIDQLVQEVVLDQVISSPTQRPRLGHLLGLDYFVAIHSRNAQGGFIIDIIDAFSGQVVASQASVPPEPEQLANAANTMLQGLEIRPQRIKQSRVAVLDFVPPASSDAANLAQIQSLNQQVRQSLAAVGFILLDRSFTNEIIREQIMHADGMTAALKTSAPLLGADYIVSGEVEGDELQPPCAEYGCDSSSRHPAISPHNGKWNLSTW